MRWRSNDTLCRLTDQSAKGRRECCNGRQGVLQRPFHVGVTKVLARVLPIFLPFYSCVYYLLMSLSPKLCQSPYLRRKGKLCVRRIKWRRYVSILKRETRQ